MMSINLYNKFGDRLGYYCSNPLTRGPKINILFSPLADKYKNFYLETETAGYVHTEPENISAYIFDEKCNQIGVICLDQEYGKYEIHIKTPNICDGRYCVFKEREIHDKEQVIHKAMHLTYERLKNGLVANIVPVNDPYKISKSMLTPTTKVDRIVFNDPATIVFWKDGTKTIVKCSDNENFNPYFGFCAAVAKRVFGNNSQVRKMVESGYFQDINDGKVKQKTMTKNISTKKSKKEKSKNG